MLEIGLLVIDVGVLVGVPPALVFTGISERGLLCGAVEALGEGLVGVEAPLTEELIAAALVVS